MKRLLITLPCFNEELVLEKTTNTLLALAADKFGASFDWQLLILDNASRDRTWAIAQGLATKFPERVITDQVWTPGRGAALRESWARHPGYDVYAYMDVDLATDLKDFPRLVQAATGEYELVTGSRYLPDSDTKRSWKRWLMSQIYNILIRLVLKVNFRDAQCGFKAFSGRLVEKLVPVTKDNGWFWDTELMILTSRLNYKFLEIPVSWREVRDELRQSTVTPWTEAKRQLRNVYHMYRRLKKDHGALALSAVSRD